MENKIYNFVVTSDTKERENKNFSLGKLRFIKLIIVTRYVVSDLSPSLVHESEKWFALKF